MAGPFQRAWCIVLISGCVGAGVVTSILCAGFRVHTAMAAALAVAVVAALYLHSRLRDTRAALERARRAKSEFLANVSHELRTPLNGIHGLSQLLARECETAERRQMAAAIQASSESLILAVDEIIDYARIEKGELKIQPTPFEVRTAIEDIAAAVAPRAREKGLAFETEVAPGVPRAILGDALRLREVLRHVLDNAVKFTAAGKVRLEVSVGGDPLVCRALLFRVRDTGPGMKPETAASFFDAFTQADSGSTRPHGGLGLGLTLAHRLVGLMGGSMGVESRPGSGSVFWFVLPTVTVEPAEPASATPNGRRGRILVVDDNPINQLVAVRAAHSLGYAADAVGGGEAALEALGRADYRAVLMDCQMPGMDGFQAAAEIRRRETSARAGRIPIIAMTANGPGSDREQCLACGMDDYLPKPFRLADLEQALKHWSGVPQPASKAG